MPEPHLVTKTNEKSSRELVFEEIYRLKLERHALELEEKGYTVVPDAIDMDMVKHLREIIICQSADKSNVEKPDIETWDGGNLREGSYLLFENPIFEKLVMNQYTVALMQYLLGLSMKLSTVYSHVRSKGAPALPLHTDQWTLQLSKPVSVAGANYALVDY